MSLTIKYDDMKKWDENELYKAFSETKDTSVVAQFDVTENGKGSVHLILVMHYTVIGKDQNSSKCIYTGYTTFDISIEKDGKPLTGQIVCKEDGNFDGKPHSHYTLIEATGDFKGLIKNVTALDMGVTKFDFN